MLFNKHPKNKKIIVKCDRNIIKEPIEKEIMEVQIVNHCCPSCHKWVRSFPVPHYKLKRGQSEKDYDEYSCLNCGCIYRIYV